jgi:hypothetical protein
LNDYYCENEKFKIHPVRTFQFEKMRCNFTGYESQ